MTYIIAPYHYLYYPWPYNFFEAIFFISEKGELGNKVNFSFSFSHYVFFFFTLYFLSSLHTMILFSSFSHYFLFFTIYIFFFCTLYVFSFFTLCFFPSSNYFFSSQYFFLFFFTLYFFSFTLSSFKKLYS